jgi:YidC/Oxa1 family membrane protein insertase
MNDIRRTVLWVVFGFSMVLLWDQWQLHQGKNATFFPAQKTEQTTDASKATLELPKTQASNDPSIPSATSYRSDTVPFADNASANKATNQRVTLTNDVLRLTIDEQGGTVVKSEFLKHFDLTAPGNVPFVLLNQDRDRYVSQTGLIQSSSTATLPTHKTRMSFMSGKRVLDSGEDEVRLTMISPVVGDVELVKTYTLRRGSYAVEVMHQVTNKGGSVVDPLLYLQLVRDGNKPSGESDFYSTFTGPVVYTEAKKYQKAEFSDIEKNKQDIEKSSSTGYVGMVQHYFASAWLLADGLSRELFMRKVDQNLYAVGMITSLGRIEPGQSIQMHAKLFIGPQEEKQLESLATGLELVKDYGWLTILAKPLYWLLDELNRIINNWGWSIVALVFLLKIAFYWLNAKAYSSMAKMKAINPKIMEMRERLKEKPQQMQQEMMRIYREEKVNPMGGCLPIAIQIPVFIALYWVLLSSVEMRNAPWILWVTDLSSKDPLYILPVLMTATTVLQTWLNPTPPDPLQAKLMWIMPLLFSFMFFFFPAGLVLYWLTNNILSIAQQWMINRQLGVS